VAASPPRSKESEERFVSWWLGVESRVIALGARFLGSRDAALDLAQDIAVVALDQFDVFKSQSHFDGWVLRRAKWVALDALRLERLHKAKAEREAQLQQEEAATEYGSSQDAGLDIEEVTAALSRLPERQRLAIEGAIAGDSTGQIAERMAISEATVRSLIRFARLRLLDLLSDTGTR
jgi:RNA polymerase sigma factor (sigma-70 family)